MVWGAWADEALQSVRLFSRDIITVPHTESLDPSTGLKHRTWEFWIKPDTVPPPSTPFVIAKKKPDSVTGIAVIIARQEDILPDRVAMGFFLNKQINTGATPQVGTTLTLHEWQHIAMTILDRPSSQNPNEDIILYKNGIRVDEFLNQENITGTNSTANLTIGAGTNDAFGGELDEFRIWTSVRTQAEIQENMHKTTSTLTGDLTKLALQFHFDDSDTFPNQIKDSSGNLNNGSVTSGSPVLSDSGAFIGDSATLPLTPTSFPFAGSFTGTDLILNIAEGNATLIGSGGKITVARIRSPHPDGTSPDVPNVSTTQFWLISHEGSFAPGLTAPTNGISTFTATMTFNLDGAVKEIGVDDPTTLKLLKRSTALTDWFKKGDADPSSVKSAVAFNNVVVEDSTDLISLFTMGGGSDNPLPVLLASFTAQPVGESVHLRWTTTVEWDNLGFNVYRSDSPQGPFRKINATRIPAKEGGGTYAWVDDTVNPSADTYYYYIEDISRFGITDVSQTIRVSLKANLGLPVKSVLFQNFPNQFNPDTWIPYQLHLDAPVTIEIYDLKGQLIRQFGLGHQAAGYYLDKSTALHWDGRNQNGEPVTSGIYVYVLRADDFLASKRMLLVK